MTGSERNLLYQSEEIADYIQAQANFGFGRKTDADVDGERLLGRKFSDGHRTWFRICGDDGIWFFRSDRTGTQGWQIPVSDTECERMTAELRQLAQALAAR